MNKVPTGTVTLLAADADRTVQPDRTMPDVVAAHRGVLPDEQPEGDRLIAAFARAGDALACAMELQRRPVAPIRPRIGLHTGEVRLGRDGGYAGRSADRAEQLRALAHRGQTLLSGVTEELLGDRLPTDVWLTELGVYPLPGAAHPQRVVQACHAELGNEFPPLATTEPAVRHRIPVQLTSFVGREAELAELGRLVRRNRLVTLTGAGGVGKTRLALELAARLAPGFGGEAWCVDLTSITDPALLPLRVARTFGLPNWPGHSNLDALARFIGDRRLLMVVDNCEHLLDACAALVTALLGACPGLTIVATSREPIGLIGELTWPTPPLALADDALELFTRRAELARPEFTAAGDDAVAMAEICRRLDGMPLAIELAAARARVLSLTDIVEGLRDRFRLLTGGARTVMPRHQTLRASVDWSHALLNEPGRVVFRRLAVFRGGFDLAAAHAVAADADVPRYRMLDELSLLVDKSLVVADGTGNRTRYRLLETLRDYAQGKLDDSGEAEAVRSRHCDHYTDRFDTPVCGGLQQRIEQAEVEIDNLRAAFGWSRERGDIERAARLASLLQPLWLRGRILEGLDWFDAVLTDGPPMAPAARARTLADRLVLDHLTGALYRLDEAAAALAIARDVDDPALLTRVLTACGLTCCYSPELARPHFVEAARLARSAGDRWQLSQVLGWQAYSAFVAGDLSTARSAAAEGRGLADAIGDGTISRLCRWCIGLTQWVSADLAGAAATAAEVAAESGTARDAMFSTCGSMLLAVALAARGDIGGARTAADAAVEAAADLGGFQQAAGFGALADAALAGGDLAAGVAAVESAQQACGPAELSATNGNPAAKVALAGGDVAAARRCADAALAAARGVHRMMLLATRVRVAIAEGDVPRAEKDVGEALAIAAEAKAYLTVPDVLECLAGLAAAAGSHRAAARLFGSAAAVRRRTGQVRFKIYDADHLTAVAGVRDGLGAADFDAAFAEGAALSTDEAIADARRGAGEHIRGSTGWAALTATELDVARLVSEGLSNAAVAARLYISPRTVQTHLTHVYAKLGLTSRVQLVQSAAGAGES